MRFAGSGLIVMWLASPVCAGLLFVCTACAEPGSRIVSIGAVDDFPEPPALSFMRMKDESGKTWHETGRVKGTLAVASGELRSCLVRQGWSIEKVIPAGNGNKMCEVSTWTRNGKNIILMVWGVDVAECGFAWGKEKAEGSR